jgi:hypothetical protein
MDFGAVLVQFGAVVMNFGPVQWVLSSHTSALLPPIACSVS